MQTTTVYTPQGSPFYGRGSVGEFDVSYSLFPSVPSSFLLAQQLLYLFTDTTRCIPWYTTRAECLQSLLGCSSYIFPGSYPYTLDGQPPLPVEPPSNYTNSVFPDVLIAHTAGLQFDFWDNGFAEFDASDCVVLGNASYAIAMCIHTSMTDNNTVVAGLICFTI